MPRRVLDPKDVQRDPVGLRAPREGRTWRHVNALGDFQPIVPGKLETGRTTRDEQMRGIISLRFKDGVMEELVLAEDRIVDVKPTKIDMEVKDGFGTVGTPGVDVAGPGAGGPRSPVDVGGQPAGRTERLGPR